MKYLVINYQYDGNRVHSFDSEKELKEYFHGMDVNMLNAVVYTISDKQDLEDFYLERYIKTVKQIINGNEVTFIAYGKNALEA
jgi:hypothetical protein